MMDYKQFLCIVCGPQTFAFLLQGELPSLNKLRVMHGIPTPPQSSSEAHFR